MDVQRSTATHRNRAIVSAPAKKGQGNAAWLSARARPGSVLLIGGGSLEHFRVRVAQSHLRHDVLPSFWSMAGVVASQSAFWTVPLSIDNVSTVPSSNAIRRLSFRVIDNMSRFPNIAVLRFAEPGDVIVRNVQKLMTQRIALDLPTLLLPWLAFVWSAGPKRNPLLDGGAIPSAALTQTAFGMAGIELAPGLASGSSSPEAIWQSAIWWHDYYEKTADLRGAKFATDEALKTGAKGDGPRAIVPAGEYQLRQMAAAITIEK
jgi:hypothetical protein